MNRRQKILHQLPVKGLLGIEIGALCRPVVQRSDGRILYSDYLSADELRERYRDDSSVDLDRIVDVDIVTRDKSLLEAYEFPEKPDYILASHVIEHVPDLVGWLDTLRAVLKPNGQVRLVVPDRRYTFDHLRSETRLCDVATAHLMKAKAPLPHSIIDHTYNMAKVDALDAWNGSIDAEKLVKYHAPETVLHFARDALENGGYHDVHCWTFTPLSFAVLFEQMATLGLLKFACDGYFDTEYGEIEFFVTLRGCDDNAEIADSWRTMRISLNQTTTGLQHELPTVGVGSHSDLPIADSSTGKAGRIRAVKKSLRRRLSTLLLRRG